MFIVEIIGYLPAILEPIAYFSIPDETSQETTIIDTTVKDGKDT